MPHNYLVTGPPRSGKTTVVQTLVDRLEPRGYRAGGVVCPEIREDGERVGFEIVDVAAGDSRVLAHVDQPEGPSVGKYRVNVPNVDAICRTAFSRAPDSADFLVVDEIAPMEVHSDEFVRSVRRALDGDVPLVAAVHYRSTAGFIGEVKDRDDVGIFEVTEATRDRLPERIEARILAVLDT
ncbi:MAG TPA: NTPase [Natrialbaceae archaeon]|nr:NTPase [Natrialbaceae archaeon]